MYLLVLFFPFLGFIFPILFGRYLGRGAFFISTFSIGMTLFLTLILFYEVVYNFSIVYVDLGYWLNLTHIQIGWSFIFDSITVSMLFIISLISFLVHFYSIYYMYNDKHYPRFMAYLSLFTFFMILLVTSNNLLLLFFGWEGSLKCLIWYDHNDSFGVARTSVQPSIIYNVLILGNSHLKIKGDQRIGPHNFDVIS
jgi:NADH:ubiquinone oxidoreductase subunit 5 (subunit L)/multisubunit Na+/H+ antiporter MnhA subunit